MQAEPSFDTKVSSERGATTPFILSLRDRADKGRRSGATTLGGRCRSSGGR